MRSDLVGRRQYIRYNGLTSSTTVVQFGVPQGSVLGPLFFILYTANVFHIAEELGIFIHGYADDLQLFDHCLACDTAQLSFRLAHCIEFTNQWVSSNRLKLNASKTKFIWLGSTRRLARCTFDPIIISGNPIKPSSMVQDHRFWHELHESCHWADKDGLLSHSSTPVYSSVAHWEFFTCPGSNTDSDTTGLLQLLSPLSRVLWAAACLIMLLPCTSSVENEICIVLHWLDVPSRVTFKLCLLAHPCLYGSALPYLIRYFTPVSSIVGRSHLRSVATGTLFVTRSQTSTIGPQAFSSPTAWNSLPVDLRLSFLTFRRWLKTCLFNPPGYLSSQLPIWQLFLHCTCLWTASGFCEI